MGMTEDVRSLWFECSVFTLLATGLNAKVFLDQSD